MQEKISMQQCHANEGDVKNECNRKKWRTQMMNITKECR